jgi:hypothetical protein
MAALISEDSFQRRRSEGSSLVISGRADERGGKSAAIANSEALREVAASDLLVSQLRNCCCSFEVVVDSFAVES